MRIIIAGSRWIGAPAIGKPQSDVVGEQQLVYEYIRQGLDALDGWKAEFVTGGAAGVDSVAREWIETNGFFPKVIRADWALHGRSAGHVRNADMAQWAVGSPDGESALILIWDGFSRGSFSMKRIAEASGIRVFEKIVSKRGCQANQVKASG